jgi:hypothetical protein
MRRLASKVGSENRALVSHRGSHPTRREPYYEVGQIIDDSNYPLFNRSFYTVVEGVENNRQDKSELVQTLQALCTALQSLHRLRLPPSPTH